MAELAELVVLIGISVILIVKVVFRPTTKNHDPRLVIALEPAGKA